MGVELSEKWVNDDKTYPVKRDICDHCGQKDEVKLSFDAIHWICKNMHACQLRWVKQMKEKLNNG